MCFLKTPDIPDPVKPAETQQARAPTRSWAVNPDATKRPGLIGSAGAATARPVTTAPGTVLGR